MQTDSGFDELVIPGYTRTMKTAISLPDAIFAQTNALAKRLKKSRSEVIADALREHLRRAEDASITQRLDAVYGDRAMADEDKEFLDQVAADIAERNPW